MGVLLSLLPLVTMGGQILTPSPLPREFRAVWVATVDNIDWPSRKDLSSDQQKRELLHILDLAKAMRLNAIIFQVRPSADAFYPSKIEPWSEWLTGQQGRAPKPFYDPLEFAVDEAHKRGMELHCWFNPYRAQHPAQKGGVSPSHIVRTNPTVAKTYGPYRWMDPGEEFVQKRSLQVILDVVKRYDIDGVHIDDYFYPYKEKGSDGKIMDFPDDTSYGRYRKTGGTLLRDDWRRKNVDDFIRNLYVGIKSEKPWVKFGISPFGIWRPGNPASIKAGVDQYGDLYADARKWLQLGWCDYFTPQLYWPIKQTPQSYPVLLDWWMQQNPRGRHVWPGNYTSRTDPTEGNWKPQEVLDQIAITRAQHADGNVHFSMKAFLQNWNGITSALEKGPYSGSALVPTSPWLDDQPPHAPKVESGFDENGSVRLTWKPDGDKDVRFWVVTPQIDGKWMAPSYIGSEANVTLEGSTASSVRFAITAIDRTGNQGPAAVVAVDPRNLLAAKLHRNRATNSVTVRL